ncbi:ABC transporter ATP-binding protein [Mechercharimyces sp. CAU 1602]|uniref:ABC transporter ATP-binding protein n=1 Tax=Mechercharimyces sp. CAU 1602 TaxID=2973933 RepID=UPI002163A22E|nr:ATP-binding cassette domain-containing protein [Mechercharimyces sp. CAU 1602]MCS1350014.1 ATP-binding cassette domain-containing protein [Mechercharimyces sp. CAU 1602]
MNVLTCKELSFTFAGEKSPTLKEISMGITPGEFVLLCGPTGSGKSTLLRMLKQEIQPAGEQSGEIWYKESELGRVEASRAAAEIGFLFQNPEHQIVMEKGLEELVFGMENLGYPPALMRRRAAEASAYLGLEKELSQQTSTLSGGEKQLLNLASLLAMKPRVLLLDEPTALLDPVHALQFLQTLKRFNQETGMTVILSEHRLEDVYPLCDRVLMLENGRLVYNGSPREGIRWLAAKGGSLRKWMPTVPATLSALQQNNKTEDDVPLTIAEGRRWLLKIAPSTRAGAQRAAASLEAKTTPPRRPLCSLEKIQFTYRNGQQVLTELNLKVLPGECVAVLGGNGSGKSTLLQVVAGLLRPRKGLVRLPRKEHRIGYLPQNIESFFLGDTLSQEIEFVTEGVGSEEGGNKHQDIVQLFSLNPLLEQHPLDLSGGERQKAALACLLLQKPNMYLLDEPTQGMDPVTKEICKHSLLQRASEGAGILFTTHDVEFAAEVATRCVMLFEGEIIVSEPTAAFFRGNDFYTTAAYRLTRETGWPEGITMKEVHTLWDGLVGARL